MLQDTRNIHKRTNKCEVLLLKGFISFIKLCVIYKNIKWAFTDLCVYASYILVASESEPDHKTLQDTTRHYKTLQDTTRHYKTRQDSTRHVKTLQDTSRHYKTLQYTTRHYKTRQYTTRHYKTLQDTTRHVKTRQDTSRHYTILLFIILKDFSSDSKLFSRFEMKSLRHASWRKIQYANTWDYLICQ